MRPKPNISMLTSSLEGVMSSMPYGVGLFLYLAYLENIKEARITTASGQRSKTLTDTIGMRIKNIRTRRGMTQEQLAEMLFVNKATISMYEHDAIDIKSSVILELALALGVRPAYFFSDDEPDGEAYRIVCSIKDIVDGFILPAS